MVKGKGLYLDICLEKEIRDLLNEKSRVPDFGNARGVRNVVDKVVQNQNDRLVRLMMEGEAVSKNDYMIIKKEDITGVTETESQSTVEDLMAQLNRLTGLGQVKKKVSAMIDSTMITKAQKEKGTNYAGIWNFASGVQGKCGNW